MAIKFIGVSFNKINNASFDIESGKITGIIGPVNSGKSDLVDLISEIVEPTVGDVNITSKSIGVVYQDIYDQFFYNNIKDEFLLKLKSHHKKNIPKKILDSLKMVGLSSKILDRSPYELSLCEQKKLSLALCLCVNPKIILLDEIFDGIDLKTKNNFIKLIRMLKLRYNKTIIILSKDVDLVHNLCDNVILINEGCIIKMGDKYDVFTDEKTLKKCNLPIPKVIKFSKMVKEMKNIDLGYRDDINDLIKDIYRFVR